MNKNAKDKLAFGKTPIDFFENYTTYLLRRKECSKKFKIFFQLFLNKNKCLFIFVQ